MECMRLSLRKGAQVALSRAAWQEIRVRSGPNEQNRWVPHISPSVGEMWEFTDLTLEVFRHNLHRPASIRSFPHLAKTGPDMGHPRPWERKIVHLSLNLPQASHLLGMTRLALGFQNNSSYPRNTSTLDLVIPSCSSLGPLVT
jgi:hypothetical protein